MSNKVFPNSLTSQKRKLHKSVRIARVWFYRETLFNFQEHFFTFLGSFFGIGLIGVLHSSDYTQTDTLFLIGSFGASSVLVYGIINSPLAQPRNLIGGHVICAIIGVTINKYLPFELWVNSALSVSLSIVMMQITKTLHPPGGATALIANIGSEKIQSLGYFYVISPVLTGVLILFVVALIFNNITPNRKYPANRMWPRRFRQG